MEAKIVMPSQPEPARPVRVIIPYRPHPSREGGLAWVKAYYEHRVGEDRVHVELDPEGGLFNKSRLVNRAAARFPGEILVIADADCVICDHSLRLAIDEVPPDQMICPHNVICRTTASQAAWLLSQDPGARVSGRMFRRRRGKHAPLGGIWVIHQELFMKHRMDERFCGWGYEDSEFLRRVPHYRFAGPLFHIWHKPQSREGTERNAQLSEQLLQAARTCSHAGIPMHQHPDVAPAMRSLFADYPSARILEIGTGAGGLTMLLRELCPDVPIRSYDVRTSPHQAMLTTAGIDARTADVFCPQVLGEITEYVRQSGRSVILCDGGDKPAELRQVAKVAKPGDLILAHDYACDRDHFHREMLGKQWDWCEITDDDWQPLPNVRKLPHQDLARVAWLVTEVRNLSRTNISQNVES